MADQSRSNQDLLPKMAGWTVVASVIVTVLVAVVSDEPLTALLFGESLGQLLLPALLVGIAAHFSVRRWPMWVYPLILLLVGISLSAALAGMSPERTDRKAQETRSDSALYRVVLPTRIAQWRKETSPESEATLEQARAAILRQFDPKQREQIKRVEGARYADGKGRVAVVLAIEPKPRTPVENELLTDPNGFLADRVGGLADPQDFESEDGKATRCGRLPEQPTISACAWARGNIFGMMVPIIRIDSDGAAQLTKTLLADAVVER